jgi:hypothetical protein
VRWCTLRQHLRLPEGFHLDPFVVYRQGEKRGWTPRRLNAGRALWRDSEAIVTDSLARDTSVLDWLRRAAGMLGGRRTYRLTLVGIGSPGQAKIDFWRAETLSLPDRYLEDPDLRLLLRTALTTLETTRRTLGGAVRCLADEVGITADGHDAFLRSQRTDERYWPPLERPFRRLLCALADAWDADGADGAGPPLQAWTDTVVATALNALEGILAVHDASPRGLRAAAITRRRYVPRLRALRAPVEGAEAA